MISLVTTVLNDKNELEVFFSHMESQTLQPNEIVIVDAGSKDGTWELLNKKKEKMKDKLKILQKNKCSIARGRNIAIEKAFGDIIVSTDIGCRWDKEWLEELVEPFKDQRIEVVKGSWAVHKEDLKSVWAKIEYVYKQNMSFIANSKSLASSRSIAYKKYVWFKVGGYPEDLTLAGDDAVYIMQIDKMEFISSAAPKIRCYWLRPEKLMDFCKEEKRNFLGAGEAHIWPEYFILVGGRLFIECFSLILGAISIFIYYPIGIFLLVIFSISFSHRIHKLKDTAVGLKELKINFPWAKLLIFIYITKI